MQNQKPEEKPKLNFEEERERMRSERVKRIKLEKAFAKIRDMELLQADKAKLVNEVLRKLNEEPEKTH